MGIVIPPGLTDDNDFVRMLNALLTGVLNWYSPGEVWVVHVDNWFDHKWLRFSGNAAVASNIPIDRVDSVKQELWQQKVTFPPFSPDRILDQWSFRRSGENYVEIPLPRVPHRHERSPSPSNLHRRIESFAGASATVFLWYSGNTLKNDRGSAMVYSLAAKSSDCWFAAFRRDRRWMVEKTKGIDRNQVLRFITLN